MTEAAQRLLSLNRKKRGVVRAKLRSRVEEVEATAILPETADSARHLTKRLEILSAEFKDHHFAVIDLLDREDDLGNEQDDKQDEEIN